MEWVWSRAAGCEGISHRGHACSGRQDSSTSPRHNWWPNTPRVLLFLATITNSLQTPYKKEKSLYHGERLPNHPFLVHQLINKEIKSMLSPKILIELLK